MTENQPSHPTATMANLYVWRSWDINRWTLQDQSVQPKKTLMKRQYLLSPIYKSTNGPWVSEDGKVTAQCKVDHHLPGSFGCRCGFYGFFDFVALFQQTNTYFHAIGLFQVIGKTTIAEIGVRTQQAEVKMIFVNRDGFIQSHFSWIVFRNKRRFKRACKHLAKHYQCYVIPISGDVLYSLISFRANSFFAQKSKTYLEQQIKISVDLEHQEDAIRILNLACFQPRETLSLLKDLKQQRIPYSEGVIDG